MDQIPIQRQYYKLLISPKQTDEIRKDSLFHVGYEASNTELVFMPDEETIFHVPFFAANVPLSATNLISCGATSGHVPAASDRIYKFQGGDPTTPYGDTIYTKNGIWLCSWLKASEDDSPPRWMDRFFNPGNIAAKDFIQSMSAQAPYIASNSYFTDMESTLVLEKGTMMKYVHAGDKTASEIVKSLEGPNRMHLTLDIEDWQEGGVDSSIYNNKIEITNFDASTMIGSPFVSDFNSSEALDFTRTFVDAKVVYDRSYITLNEMTFLCWVYSPSWKDCNFTQFIGNYTSRGGFGLFYDNLLTTPFIAIPETRYGHILFLNENLEFYHDQSVQQIHKVESRPTHIALSTRDNSVIVADNAKNSVDRLRKYDYIGDVVAVAHQKSGNNYELFRLDIDEEILFTGIGENEKVYLQTTKKTYIFDKHLQLISTTSLPANYNANNCAFCFDNYGNYKIIENKKEARYVLQDLWTLSDGVVKCNEITVHSLSEAVWFEVFPDNTQIWALMQDGSIKVIDTKTFKILAVIPCEKKDKNQKIRQGGFIRKTDTKEWYFLCFFANSQNLFCINTQTFEIEAVVGLSKGLSPFLSNALEQNTDFAKFEAIGDFTGSEYRRIFDRLEKNGRPRILFRSTNKNNTKQALGIPYKQFEIEISTDSLIDRRWHMLAFVIENQNVSLFVDGKLQTTKAIPDPDKSPFTVDFHPSFYIGTPTGKYGNLNNDIKVKTIKFNGFIDSVKAYNIALTEEHFLSHIRAKFKAQPLIWEIQTPPIQYIDTIEKVFRFRFPGLKSPFYKIRIKNSKITNPKIREYIEKIIKAKMKTIAPIYADLIEIEWIDSKIIK